MKDKDNVVRLQTLTKLDIPVDVVLENIKEEDYNHIFLIGWPKDGSMPKYHSTTGDAPVVMHRLNDFIHKFYNGEFGVV